jgi:hypothetical protein
MSRSYGAVFGLFLSACSNGANGDSKCGVPLELLPGQFIAEAQPLLQLHDGDQPLFAQASQGGQVLMVGAEVFGLSTDIVRIEASFREPGADEPLVRDVRTILMLPIAGREGWMQPQLLSRSQVAHLVPCPNYGARAILGEPWLLEMGVRESGVDCPREGKVTLTISPTCEGRTGDDLARCECDCQPNYIPGACVQER